jgi:hypothetical protein
MAEIFTSVFTKMKSRGGLKWVQRAKVPEVAWHHPRGIFVRMSGCAERLPKTPVANCWFFDGIWLR